MGNEDIIHKFERQPSPYDAKTDIQRTESSKLPFFFLKTTTRYCPLNMRGRQTYQMRGILGGELSRLWGEAGKRNQSNPKQNEQPATGFGRYY